MGMGMNDAECLEYSVEHEHQDCQWLSSVTASASSRTEEAANGFQPRIWLLLIVLEEAVTIWL